MKTYQYKKCAFCNTDLSLVAHIKRRYRSPCRCLLAIRILQLENNNKQLKKENQELRLKVKK